MRSLEDSAFAPTKTLMQEEKHPRRETHGRGMKPHILYRVPASSIETLDNPPASGVVRDRQLLVLVGISGAGKDTLVKRAGKRRTLRKPISLTTRDKREEEVDGVDYYFITTEEFQRYINDGRVFEWAEFDGHLYGTLTSELQGDGVRICIRENRGAKAMKEQLGAIVIGLVHPSFEAMARRLAARGDTPEDIERRLAIDSIRAEEIREFADFIIVNHDLDEADDTLIALIDELRAQAAE